LSEHTVKNMGGGGGGRRNKALYSFLILELVGDDV